jgi:3-deoxy-7-phosphoheptulonate synthase
MVECNINAGNQSSDLAIADVVSGVSVTDACIDLNSSKTLLSQANDMLSEVLNNRIAK